MVELITRKWRSSLLWSDQQWSLSVMALTSTWLNRIQVIPIDGCSINANNVSSIGIYTEKPFYEEALILTRGYKPISEKLVEPINPLKIDTSNDFNSLTLLGAQVSDPILSFFSPNQLKSKLGSNSNPWCTTIWNSLLLCY